MELGVTSLEMEFMGERVALPLARISNNKFPLKERVTDLEPAAVTPTVHFWYNNIISSLVTTVLKYCNAMN